MFSMKDCWLRLFLGSSSAGTPSSGFVTFLMDWRWPCLLPGSSALGDTLFWVLLAIIRFFGFRCKILKHYDSRKLGFPIFQSSCTMSDTQLNEVSHSLTGASVLGMGIEGVNDWYSRKMYFEVCTLFVR